jgi:hypothetical protein
MRIAKQYKKYKISVKGHLRISPVVPIFNIILKQGLIVTWL